MPQLAAIAPLLDQARALPFGVDAAAAADPVVPRPVADRQTRRRRARGVSPRVAAHAAAAADRPAGRPDARAYPAAGVPLRGDEGLSDARLRRSAGSWPRQGMDEPRLAVAVAGPRGEGPARQPGAASRRAARPAAGEGAARRRPDRGCAPHVQPRHRWRSASTARSRARSRRARCRPGGRPMPPGASGVRVFIRRSGAPLTEGVAGFYTLDGFYKVLLPNLPSATMQVASESWVLGKDAQIDPASPQVLTLQRDVIALYTAEYAKQWDAPAGRSRYRADAQPAAGGAGSVYPCLAAIADARPARRYHPSAHPDPAAAIAARPRRCRPGRGAGCDRGGSSGSGHCRRPAARYPRSRQRAAAGTAGQGNRGSLRRADRASSAKGRARRSTMC